MDTEQPGIQHIYFYLLLILGNFLIHEHDFTLIIDMGCIVQQFPGPPSGRSGPRTGGDPWY